MTTHEQDDTQARQVTASVLEMAGGVAITLAPLLPGRARLALAPIGELLGVVARQLRLRALDRSEWLEVIEFHADVDEVDTDQSEERIRAVLRRMEGTDPGPQPRQEIIE